MLITSGVLIKQNLAPSSNSPPEMPPPGSSSRKPSSGKQAELDLDDLFQKRLRKSNQLRILAAAAPQLEEVEYH